MPWHTAVMLRAYIYISQNIPKCRNPTRALGCAGAGVVRAGVARADGGVLGGVAGRAAVVPPAGRAAGEDPGGGALKLGRRVKSARQQLVAAVLPGRKVKQAIRQAHAGRPGSVEGVRLGKREQ